MRKGKLELPLDDALSHLWKHGVRTSVRPLVLFLSATALLFSLQDQSRQLKEALGRCLVEPPHETPFLHGNRRGTSSQSGSLRRTGRWRNTWTGPAPLFSKQRSAMLLFGSGKWRRS